MTTPLIASQLKPLYANFLRLQLQNFLITDGFNHLMIENDWDQGWDSCLEAAHRMSGVAVLVPGYTGYARDALAFMLEGLRKSSTELLLDFFAKTMAKFIEWSDDAPSVEGLREPLLTAGCNSGAVDTVLNSLQTTEISKTASTFSLSDNSPSDAAPSDLFLEGIAEPFDLVVHLCSRFRTVAHYLRKRHDGRDTLDIVDEYDVQDLLHALLRAFFDDVRPEEYTPSYAGKASRMDFLLKQHGIVIEVKMTRKGLADKEIGEQLIIDIERYRSHQDCKTLVCFVYDPECRIVNPAGLQADLNSERDGRRVVLLIVPRP